MEGRMARREEPDFDTVLTGDTEIDPVLRFSDANLKAPFVRNLVRKFGREIPTAIQKFSIPAVTKGLHVIGLSQTGSGKTGAYMVPIINSLLENYSPPNVSEAEPLCLILAPTRELALQIRLDAEELANGTVVLCGSVYGGKSPNGQLAQIREKGVHILTATTGRLQHDLNVSPLNLSKLRFVVVDEADHMLERDFNVVNGIFRHRSFPKPPAAVQFLFYSATKSQLLMKKAGEVMKSDPRVTIECGKIGCANPEIDQVFLDTPEGNKFIKLVELIKESKGKTLIFVSTKDRSQKIMMYLEEDGITAENICSFNEQVDREKSLEALKKGEIQCLVATDVACRGIHIPGPLHVINYELPQMGTAFDKIRSYVHRIGRTGRMGDRGRATSFFSKQIDGILGPYLYRQLVDRGQPVPEFIMEYRNEAEGFMPTDTASGARNYSRRHGPRNERAPRSGPTGRRHKSGPAGGPKSETKQNEPEKAAVANMAKRVASLAIN